MALIEGGSFKCDTSNFETSSIDEWNEHCLSHNIHTESGSTACIVCRTPIEFTDLPFHPLDARGSKNIALKCPECDEKTRGSVKINTVKAVKTVQPAEPAITTTTTKGANKK
jgi:hypothetical protein